MAQQIQLRNGTAAEWTTANPILAVGELGLETDTSAYKIGDGVKTWTALSYRQLSGEWQTLLLGAQASDPPSPAAGKLLIYTKDIAGRVMPKWIGPSGVDTPIQPAFFANGIQLLSPSAATAFSVVGMAAPTAVGTVSHPAIATGSIRTSTRRGSVLSAATANASAELRSAITQCYRGEAVGGKQLGGFFLSQRIAVNTATAWQRGAFGLFATTAAIATTQNPSGLTNCIFAGFDSADANLQIMSNGAAGGCVKVNLGSNYPASTVGAIYDIAFFARPNSDTVGWRVVRLDADVAIASGTIVAANLPVSTTFLSWHAYMNNGGTAAAAGFDIMRFYLETDY